MLRCLVSNMNFVRRVEVLEAKNHLKMLPKSSVIISNWAIEGRNLMSACEESTNSSISDVFIYLV